MNATQLIRLAAVVSAVVLMASCGGSDSPDTVPVPQPIPTPVPTPTPQESASAYLQALPKWEQFSPKLDDTPANNVSTSPDFQERIDYPIKDTAGNVVGVRSEQYNCKSSKFSLTSTPEKIVMFSPDREVVWPGALIQGRSHRDGLGSLLPLTIAERAAINVSIPSLATSENYRSVDTPDQAEVNQAIGTIVGNATTNSLATPSSIQFTMSDYTSEQSFALSAGLSGKYLGFKGSASGSLDTKANEHTVMVYFIEKMFEVVVEAPQSPGAFFNAGFTREKLDQQIAMGRIGTGNLPVYVSNVVYGRMMAFTLTSTASETDIKAALNAAYKGIFEVNFNLKSEYKTILQNSRITVTSLGGSSTATIAMIASGNWRDYFNEPAPLSSAYPLSYTFRNLGDGSIAKVSETTEYEIKECSPANTAGFMLESFESSPVDWLPIGTTALSADWGDPATPQSVFYGYLWAKHTNKLTSNFFAYDVGYLKAPHFSGIQSDYYRGELSFWFKPDENFYTVDSGWRQHCYWKLVWPVPPIFDYVCVWVQYPVNGKDKLTFLSDTVLAYDDYTAADQVVLRGGGVQDYEVLTLTYNPKDATIPLQWAKRSIVLRNDDVAGKTLCDENKRGCWLVEDRAATEHEIQYVLSNVKELRLRASYPVMVKRKVCMDNPPPVDPVPCVNQVDATERIPLGYVGGYFDEIKFTKPNTGF